VRDLDENELDTLVDLALARLVDEYAELVEGEGFVARSASRLALELDGHLWGWEFACEEDASAYLANLTQSDALCYAPTTYPPFDPTLIDAIRFS
jgi:hypothetical protein